MGQKGLLMTIERRTYTVPETARILGCSTGHLYDMITEGKFEGVIRIGRKVVIARHVVDDMITPPTVRGSVDRSR